ncbi:MAG: hypothetical protein WAW96_10290, partial [Alphaproteobacteria bacterium]
RKETRLYPLKPGLSARIHRPRDGAFGRPGPELADGYIDIGLRALAGTSGKTRPTPEDYAADATAAYSSGDLLGANLVFLAFSAHYPDEMSLCEAPDAPARCKGENEQFSAAVKDPRARHINEGAAHCAHGEKEAGAREIGRVDVSGEKYGYVASFILACLLEGMPPEKAKSFVDDRYPPTSEENALRAIEANPFIPGYYYDTGMRYIDDWDLITAHRLWEIGMALGGGVKGDAYDTSVAPREQYLLKRYPGLF